METEKRVEPQEKQNILPSEEKQVETPSNEVVPPSTEWTPPSKEEHEKLVSQAVNDAEARVQSGLQGAFAKERREWSQKQATAQAAREEADMVARQARELKDIDELEPDLKERYKQLHDRESRVNYTMTQTIDVLRHGHAYRIGKKYGVDAEALLEANSEEEMETTAKSLTESLRTQATEALEKKNKDLEVKLAEAQKTPQKIDSSAPSAHGIDWRSLSSGGKIRAGLK